MSTKLIVDTNKGIINAKKEEAVKTINSLELVEQINGFRKLEDRSRAELKHSDLLKVIRDEFEEEIQAGKISSLFYEAEVGNGAKKKLPMFELTYSQAKQVLVRESKFVRRHIIAYIEELEKRVSAKPMLPQTYKEALQELLLKVEENEKLQIALDKSNKQLEHKTEVLTGVVEDVDVYRQREILNRIVRAKGADYSERWSELYRVFKETKHVDISARRKGYNLKNSPKCKTNLEYAEKFGFIPELYKIAIKLFETDYQQVLDNIKRGIEPLD